MWSDRQRVERACLSTIYRGIDADVLCASWGSFRGRLALESFAALYARLGPARGDRLMITRPQAGGPDPIRASMDLTADYRFALGQKVASKAAHYVAGEVGTVVARQPGLTRPGYIVEFGDEPQGFLTEDQLEAHCEEGGA